MNPILIHKGDCTIFANVNKFLTFNLETDLDLTGWQAKFILGWVEKTIDDISTKSFEIILGAEDTKQLRLGKQYGTIILTDSNGNIKTVTNTIPFEVTTAVVENEYQEIDLTIPESSGVDIKLKVGASYVTSVNGMVGDVNLTIPSIEGLATEQQLAQGLNTKQDKGDYALKEEIPSLEGYVKNTDYATNGVGGVMMVAPYYGTSISSGYLVARNVGLSLYQNDMVKTSFVSKGTLENIKDDYVKRGITENQTELSEDEKTSAKNWLGYATPTDIMQAIASIPQFKMSIVEELPLAGEKMTLYLVPKEGTNNDVYDEYIWIEQTESFEHLGTTAVDLSDYVKNTDYATTDKAGVIKTTTSYGLAVSSTTGTLYGATKSLALYNSANDVCVVCKGTLENVLTQYSKTVLTTEADYNALETKDANTLYLIEE